MDAEQFVYSALGPGNHIRVLNLLPALNLEDDIHCCLLQVSLDLEGDNTPTYEALSYVWGSREGDLPISCDGKKLFVTQNCLDALRHLRLADKARMLWVDAICINQKLVAEKNHQVKLMADIYRLSYRTLIWFGPGSSDGTESFRWVRWAGALLRNTTKHRQFEAIVKLDTDTYLKNFGEPLQHEISPADLADEKPSYIFKRGFDGHYTRSEVIFRNENIEDKELHESRMKSFWQDRRIKNAVSKGVNNRIKNCLSALHSHKWFTRAWTLQELCVSRQALVCCGRLTVPWKSFCICIDHLLHYHGLNNISGAAPLRYYLYTELSSQIYTALLRGQEKQAHPVFHGNAVSLLHLVRQRKASDRRDMVYCLHGIFLSLGITLRAPDYNLPVPELYASTTFSFIRESRSLSILETGPSQTRSTDLPSWVPDFSQPSGVPLSRHKWHEDLGSTRWHKDWSLEIAYMTKNKNLLLLGKTIDYVKQVGARMLFSQRPDNDDLIGPYRDTTITKHFNTCLVQWFHIAESLEQYSSRQKAAESLWRMLIGQTHTINPLSQKTSTRFLRFFNLYYKMTMELYDPVVIAHMDQNPSSRNNSVSLPLTHDDMLPWVCAVQSKDFGEGRDEAEFSHVTVATGLKRDLAALEHHLVASTSFQALVTTKAGMMAFCLGHPEEGDEVVLFVGASCPFLVRPHHSCYTLVGPVYEVHIKDDEWPADEKFGGLHMFEMV